MVELRGRYVDALVAGDLTLAERLIEDAGTDVRTLYLQVLQPALYEIGRRWQQAEISVAQEHLATATTQSLMARLAGRFDSRAPRRDKRVLVACAEGELHSIGVRMVADFLEADGWEVLFVGALSPPSAVAELAATQRVAVVALSAALGQRVPEIATAVTALRALEEVPVIAVGGQAFGGDADVALATGADLYAPDAAEFARELAILF
jgi:methanogenic corrinoid protein MtbC1